MPESRHFILGTAGHIDHGKSSLVRALTGTDPDRLPEEKLRGVTIELGFAHLSLPDPKTPDLTYELGVVDVPGHADFINNMVAGVGGMDAALFVVAADDGWMPQSEEHLHILSYLGITRAVIALTKADLVEDVEFAAEFVRECLKGSALERATIIPVCAPKGQGLDEIRAELTRLLAEATPPADFGKPILPVDRAFQVKGIGTVVTGTLSGGSLHVGDDLRLQPREETAHVRSIQNHNASVQTALPGMRTALNVPDLNVAGAHRFGVHRGALLTGPHAGEPSETINVLLTRSDREIPGQSGTRRVLPAGRRVRIHHGSGSIGARIYFLDGGSLAPGHTKIAQLRLDEKRYMLVGDRFVLRDWSGQATVAGGTVLETTATRQRFRSDAQKEFLEARAADPDSLRALLRSTLRRDHTAALRHLAAPLRATPQQVSTALNQLIAADTCIALGDYFADAAWWSEIVKSAQQAVLDFHQAQPDLPGLPLQEFRKSLPPNISEILVTHLFQSLAAEGVGSANNVLTSKSFSASLPDDIREPAARIEAALTADPLNPPGRAELTPDGPSRRALAFLIRTKRVIALGDKAVLFASALQAAENAVLNHLDQHGPATASDLRQALGTSRRIAMPLLEGMDQKGLTKRDGDLRKRC